MNKKANMDIREMLNKKNIKHWVLADCIGISESTLVRILRKELPQNKKDYFKSLILKIEKEGVKYDKRRK